MGTIALFSGKELELLAEMEPEEMLNQNYELEFLKQIQEAADRHLQEKREIRDALGLLKIYHHSEKQNKSPSKRRKQTKNWIVILYYNILLWSHSLNTPL